MDWNNRKGYSNIKEEDFIVGKMLPRFIQKYLKPTNAAPLEIGIISFYKDQVTSQGLNKLKGLSIDVTVDSFQGTFRHTIRFLRHRYGPLS